MKKIDFIHELRDQLNELEHEIKNHEKLIQESSLSLALSYADELKLLKMDKIKLLDQIEKIQSDSETIIDDIKLTLKTAHSDLKKKWETLKLSQQVKQHDYNYFLDALKKSNKNPNDYDIKVDIDELQNEEHKVVAIRLIDIANAKTNISKSYPASKKDTSWQKEFKKDLKEDFFSKK